MAGNDRLAILNHDGSFNNPRVEQYLRRLINDVIVENGGVGGGPSPFGETEPVPDTLALRTETGTLKAETPTANDELTTKQYVDDAIEDALDEFEPPEAGPVNTPFIIMESGGAWPYANLAAAQTAGLRADQYLWFVGEIDPPAWASTHVKQPPLRLRVVDPED